MLHRPDRGRRVTSCETKILAHLLNARSAESWTTTARTFLQYSIEHFPNAQGDTCFPDSESFAKGWMQYF